MSSNLSNVGYKIISPDISAVWGDLGLEEWRVLNLAMWTGGKKIGFTLALVLPAYPYRSYKEAQPR